MKAILVFAFAVVTSVAGQAQVIIMYTPSAQYRPYYQPAPQPYPVAPYVARAALDGAVLAAQARSAYLNPGMVPLTMPITYQRFDYDVQYAYRNYYLQRNPQLAPYYPPPRRSW